jgi:selenocysteine-specific elongation factor
VAELARAGLGRDLIAAAAAAGLVVQIAPDLVVSPDLIARARAEIERRGDAGTTVSAIREALGTSRKYAVPLMEYLDRQGWTRRDGDLRFPRRAGA